MKKFVNYKLLCFTLLTLCVSIGLQAVGLNAASSWILGLVSATGIILHIWEVWQDLRVGKYGVDIIAIVAAVTALLLKEYTVGAVIVLSLLSREVLQDTAQLRTETELKNLLARSPRTARVLRGRKDIEIKVSEVRVGDKLLIKSGEIIPVDSTALKTGTALAGGSINKQADMTVRAAATAENSQYRRIIRVLRSALGSGSPFTSLAHRSAIIYSLLTLTAAGLLWFISGDSVRFLRAAAVSTPSPFILAAPLALAAGINKAAQAGIFFRSGSVMERLAAARSIITGKSLQKASLAKKIQAVETAKNRPVVYAGDGVLDAPALTAADIGIALGTEGSAAATEAADIIILSAGYSQMDKGIDIARRALASARLAIATGTVFGLILLAVVATSSFNLIFGVILKEIISIIVVLLAVSIRTGSKRQA